MYPARNLIIIILICYIGLLNAQSNSLQQQQEIKIGITHAPPLIYLINKENPEGMLIDFLHEVAIHENWKITWIMGSWPKVFNLAKDAKLDVMTYVANTPERTQYFNFSHESFITGWGQVYTHNSSNYQDILDFDQKKIAVVKDDVHEGGIINFCNEFNVECKFVYVEDYDQAFDLLKKNK